MKLVRIEEVRPGQKVAKDVTDLRGNLLFKAGTEMTPDLISRCKQRTVTHLFMEDGGGPPASPPDLKKRQEEAALEIDRLFAGTEANAVMAALREAAKRHALARLK